MTVRTMKSRIQGMQYDKTVLMILRVDFLCHFTASIKIKYKVRLGHNRMFLYFADEAL